jgi:hypothetical protein
MKNIGNLEIAIADLKTLDRVRDTKEDAIATEILRLYPKFSVSENWKRRIGHA